MKDVDEIFNDLVKIEMLEREVRELVDALAIYSNPDNWHNNYDVEGSLPGEGPKVIWARQENGWEIAQRALGDF